MRSLLLLATIASAMGLTFKYPFVGLLVWVWFSIMSPQDASYGTAGLPLNLVIAVVTLLSALVSRDKKTPPNGSTAVLFYVFFVWITFNQFVAGVSPGLSLPLWDRIWKIFLMGAVAATLANSKVRFHALVWITVVALGYWTVKGGLFTLITGGGSHALGPESSQLGDNNKFALAEVMLIPFFNYLRLNSGNRAVRAGLLAASGLTVVSVLGSYSRGGFIALAAVSVAFWFRSRNKLVYPVAAVLIAVFAVHFMPDSFWDRMQSINSYQTDDSFDGRLNSWYVAWHYARDNFPFGAGFDGASTAGVYHRYVPDVHPLVAHSIYFEVLGDDGFIGLALYIALLVSTFLDYSAVISRTKRVAEWRWAHDLARMSQVSLIGFCVAGAALSMAYYDLFVLLVWVGIALKRFTQQPKQSLASNLALRGGAGGTAVAALDPGFPAPGLR